MRYQVVYADPPWRYAAPGATTPGRRIEANYSTMSDNEICAMNVPSDPRGSVCFLWATAPKLPEAFTVLAAWGFNYRTCAVWDKEIIGMGFWFRGQHELLLVGTQGTFSPPSQGDRVSSVLRCRRGEHSSKPDFVRDLIRSWYPEAACLEMFARESHQGWDAFGNEVAPTLFDQEPRLVEIA